ncbi:MAG: hypothetical protein KJ624_07710 [Chloroflexi bacterium]|nr:hypothetical protein [Chloroflexota bacterium]
MAGTILGYYFVAFIDIVGQRDRLKQLVSLPKNDAERKAVAGILSETSAYVKDLRGQFDTLFEMAAKPTGLLDGLKPEQRAWAEQRKRTTLWRRGFSDSYFMTVPCWHEQSWGAHTLAIYGSLFSICGMFIWALAKRKPFRGAVEVGLGTEIAKEEVYGPVNVRVFELEKNAGCPRIIIGKGLLDHLDDLEKRCSDSLEGRHTKHSIQDCRNLVTTDYTDTLILDPMGEGVKAVPGAVAPEMVERAYRFVVSEEQSFGKSGKEPDEKLHRYYGDLRKYCESRLGLWNLRAIQ